MDRPISELVAELPQPTLVHRQLPCPWAMKGLVMRVLNERLAGRDVDLTDGIKVFDERGWAQVLPDPDEPLIHLYAEGETTEASEELVAELRGIVEEIEQGEADSANLEAQAPDWTFRPQRLKFRLTLRAKGSPWNRCPILLAVRRRSQAADRRATRRRSSEVSYQRRLLHGKIDILRAELVARLKTAGPETSSTRSTSSR